MVCSELGLWENKQTNKQANNKNKNQTENSKEKAVSNDMYKPDPGELQRHCPRYSQILVCASPEALSVECITYNLYLACVQQS